MSLVQQQPTINGNNPGEESRKVCAQEVGWMFAKQYYNMMNSDPSRLYKFYGKKSTFIQGTEGEVVRQANGQQEIRAAIAASDFKDCRVAVSNVDTLPAIGDGILIQVLGKISFSEQAPRVFCQTFLLAEQPGGYYLHNNILRYLKEEEDELDGANSAGAAAETAAASSEVPVEAAAAPAPEAIKAAAAVPKDEKVDVSEDVEKEVAAVSVEAAAESAPEVGAEAKAAATEEQAAPKPAAPVSAKAEAKPKAAREKPATPVAEASVAEEAPKTEKPAAAAAAAPVPSKPTSWANLAANNSNKWGNRMAKVEGTVAPASNMPNASPEPSVRVGTPTSGPRDGRRRNEALSVFLKNIPQATTVGALKEAFGVFGPVASVDFIAHKTTGIVEFSSEAAKQKALNAGSITVLTNRVVIEERRGRSDSKQQRSGGGNKQPSGSQPRNGSGDFERVGSGRGSRSRTATASGGSTGGAGAGSGSGSGSGPTGGAPGSRARNGKQ
ncbi:hypothetical protein H4217_004186 [Coemansia sp. RSA 1939]|nr:hypothetical protein H4217_004186 [Coemansia sp. RSA 1939]KAJ2608559.1 hypothetical protein EV177_004914 [Coemansia sp. RSA 1804]